MEMLNILAVDADANEYALALRPMIETGVGSVKTGDVRIEKISGGIEILDAAGMGVEICTLDGKIVKTFIASDSVESISLSSGVYLVKAGGKTVKVML